MANTAALAKLDQMEHSYVALKNRLGTIKQHAKAAVDNTTRTLEVTAGGFVGGFAEGYFENGEVFGFPALLAVGVGGHVAAYMLDDDTGKHVRNVADGALAAFAASKGAEIARDWVAKGAGHSAARRPNGGGGARTTGDQPGQRGQKGMHPDEFRRAFSAV